MKAKEVKSQPVQDAIKKVADLREELFNLRIQNLSGSLENTSKIRQTRREIARMLTMSKMTETKN